MKHGTGIGWTHVKHPDYGILYKGETWNPVVAYRGPQPGWACELASPACQNCYAQTMNIQRPNGRGTGLDYRHGHDEEIKLTLGRLDVPVRKKKQRCFFVMSMTDPFYRRHLEAVPEHPEASYLDFVVANMLAADQHLYLFLTKHPHFLPGLVERMLEPRGDLRLCYAADQSRVVLPAKPSLSNIWFGCSVENQAWADKRRDGMYVASAYGCTTFVSYEPALGPVDFSAWSFLDWLVMGGESGGAHVRAPHPEWFINALRWCAENGTAPYFKQWGSFHAHPVNAAIAGQFVLRDGSERIATPVESLPPMPAAFMRYAGPSPTAGGLEIQGGPVQQWPYHRLPKPLTELSEVYREQKRSEAHQESLF